MERRYDGGAGRAYFEERRLSGFRKLAHAVLMQAYRDLGRPTLAESTMQWFRDGTYLGLSDLTVAGELDVRVEELIELAERIAADSGVRRSQGKEWLRRYMPQPKQKGQDDERT